MARRPSSLYSYLARRQGPLAADRLILYSRRTPYWERTSIRNEPITEAAPQRSPAHAKSSWQVALLCVCLAATAVITPMFFLGNASGHDVTFHLASWMDVAGQWREAIVYPRWAEWANFGFGEPRFVFYPPASWMAGAALGSLLPWRMVPAAFIWLTLIMAGMAMWKLAREWLPGPQAIVAALLYAVNPYHLVIVYYRSDFAELLAGALFPVLVWAALHAMSERWEKVPLLAAVFGGIWRANAPAAVIATYSLGLIFVIACVVRRSLRPLLPGAVAMAAGFALAAFYVLPAASEQRWVQISQAISDSGRPAENFLFTHANDPAFQAFNWRVSWVALGMIIVTGVAAVFIAKKRRDEGGVWRIMAGLGVVSVALMLPPSSWLWRALPELQFVQFPWRWLEVLALVFAFFVAAAMSRAPGRRLSWLLIALLFAAIGAAATAMVKSAFWDSTDVPEVARAIGAGHGYEGTDEYAPTASDRLQLPGNPDDTERPDGVSPDPAPRFGKLDRASGAVIAAKGVRLHAETWSAEHRVFTAETATPVTLAVRLIDYPAWRVQVDGKDVTPDLQPETGQILLPLPAGTHRVKVDFRRTWDRTTGDAISGLSALALVGFAWGFRRPRA